MFDGSITDDFMKNKFEAEQQLTLIEAEKVKEKANTPVFGDRFKQMFEFSNSLMFH